VNVCCELNIIDRLVISIQGIISTIYGHYSNGLNNSVTKSYTFRDFIRRDNIKLQSEKFKIRGENEIIALKKAKHVIGRTSFDKAVSFQINPQLKYHYLNESLRPSFYNNKWDINKSEKHSIFLSQSYYPVKGFHYLLEAMPLILERFPKAHIYTTGNNLVDNFNLTKRLRENSYSKYLRKQILFRKLEDRVTFLGNLSEQQMCERYLKSNVFVCPSSIENSPNSLGEAMILGVPSVAAYVGGIPDMIKDKDEGFLYQHDATYMLAHYICEIFNNDNLALELSENSRAHALRTHDRTENMRRLIEIYKDISD
jgi:glycosyltransferase involved in cell wall biosynthesis